MNIGTRNLELSDIPMLKDILLREKEILTARIIKINKIVNVLDNNPKIQEFLQILSEINIL